MIILEWLLESRSDIWLQIDLCLKGVKTGLDLPFREVICLSADEYTAFHD